MSGNTNAWAGAILIKALQAQLSQGAQAYDFGGEAGLVDAFQQGKKLADFNLEQQGDICSLLLRTVVQRRRRERLAALYRGNSTGEQS